MGATIDPIWVSEKRFAEYLDAADGDPELASRLYEWNARVSSALFELIHHVEVLLRNAVIGALARNGTGPNLPPGSPWVQNARQVDDVIGRLRKLGKEPTEARVLAGLTFGFWQSMFGADHEELWRQALQFVFPNSRGDRKTIAAYLQSISLLRNRIAHHGSLIERDTLVEARKMLTFAGWIDLGAAEWLRGIERVTEVTGDRPVRPKRNVVVVAADRAWRLYHDMNKEVYVFQAARTIQLVDYVAFYTEQEIKETIPRIERHLEAVDWNKANARRLLRSDDAGERAVGGAIEASMRNGWNESVYQVFLLSKRTAAETVTLPRPINHSRRGRGSAFVRAHRYIAMSALSSAQDTADLER